MSKSHREAVQRQFTRTAKAFATVVRDSEEVLAEKVAFIKAQPGDLVLDVACGPGALVLALAPTVKFAFGVDLTEAMVRHARQLQLERNIPNAAFELGEAEQLPYADAAFDLVTCQCSLHHMIKPVLALREMVRVVKPDGRLVIIDTLGPESESKFELHNRIETTRDPSHTAALRLTTLLEIFDGMGLAITRQAVKRRQRSFNDWMLRAGTRPGKPRYEKTRRLLEESIPGDRGGYSAQVEGDDIVITHHEALFLLAPARS